jgi:hypothetical protein
VLVQFPDLVLAAEVSLSSKTSRNFPFLFDYALSIEVWISGGSFGSQCIPLGCSQGRLPGRAIEGEHTLIGG